MRNIADIFEMHFWKSERNTSSRIPERILLKCSGLGGAKYVTLVDLVKNFPTRIYLQNRRLYSRERASEFQATCKRIYVSYTWEIRIYMYFCNRKAKLYNNEKNWREAAQIAFGLSKAISSRKRRRATTVVEVPASRNNCSQLLLAAVRALQPQRNPRPNGSETTLSRQPNGLIVVADRRRPSLCNFRRSIFCHWVSVVFF